MHKHPSLCPVTPPLLTFSFPFSPSCAEQRTVLELMLIVCRSVQLGMSRSLLHCVAHLGPLRTALKDKLSYFLNSVYKLFSAMWHMLNIQNGMRAFCPLFHFAMNCALHSWILCNCEGPLLYYVPGNLIFTAAPDRNHLTVLVRLYWKWKIATAVYCFK